MAKEPEKKPAGKKPAAKKPAAKLPDDAAVAAGIAGLQAAIAAKKAKPKNKGGRPIGTGVRSPKKEAKVYPSLRSGKSRVYANYKRLVAGGNEEELLEQARKNGTLEQFIKDNYPASKLDSETGMPIRKEKPYISVDEDTGARYPTFTRDEDYLDHVDRFRTSNNGQFPEKGHSHPWQEYDHIDMTDTRIPSHFVSVIPADGYPTVPIRNVLRNAMRRYRQDEPDLTFAHIYRGGGLATVYARARFCKDCNPANPRRKFDAPPASVATSGRLM